MPSPYIKSLSKLSGKPDKEIEKLWKKAKDIASDTFDKEEIEFEDKEYSYTVGIVKEMLGIKEEILDPSKFLNSDFSAKEYLETITSSGFPSLDKHIVNKNPLDDKDKNPKVIDIEKEKGFESKDGTGPHGKGLGPGKGKKDGSGKDKKGEIEIDILEGDEPKITKSESYLKSELSKLDDLDWGKELDKMSEVMNENNL